MLRFAYQDEPLSGPPPPSLRATANVRWRPLVPVTLIGLGGRRRLFARAVLDPGADDTVFPMSVLAAIGVSLRADSGHTLRWRGQGYNLRFAGVELELDDGMQVCRWPATIGFSQAPLRYPILGICGCLQFFDARFLGERQFVELDANSSFLGSQRSV